MRLLQRIAIAPAALVPLAPAAAAADAFSGPVEALACAPSDPDAAGLISAGVVWITRDGGATWRASGSAAWLSDPSDGSDPSDTSDLSDLSDAPDLSDLPTPPLHLHLAIGDRGEWAAARGGRWIADSGAGARRFEEPSCPIAGMAFDASSLLWVACGDRVTALSPGKAPRTAVIAGAGGPVAPASGGVVVPGRVGTFALAADAGGAISARRIGRPAKAAAVGSDSGALFTSSPGGVFRRSAGVDRALPGAPPNATRLLAGARGLLWARSAEGWLAGAADSPFRRIAARAVAVDALGRAWLGTDAGPLPPRAGVPAGRARPEGAAGARAFAARAPPPCSPDAAALLPAVKLWVTLARGSRASEALPPVAKAIDREASVAAGLLLTWALAPAADAACAARGELFYEREARRLERFTEQRDRLAAAAAEAAAATTVEAALGASAEMGAAAARLDAIGDPTAAGEKEDVR